MVPLNDIVVILTGSTGSLGSYILASLLVDPRVLKVYAFNRASSASSNRQLASFEDRGLPTDLLKGSKYIPVTGDFNAERFGLNEDVFTEVRPILLVSYSDETDGSQFDVAEVVCYSCSPQRVEGRLQSFSRFFRVSDCWDKKTR